ncbi:kinase suppressor of Ras 2 [Manacus vitellinus]|uniref:kinase suppressor of Ras 2 n=1 Tax=Manacus vitellinus TaxID=328815 RepID=UPI00115D2A63|nr:kinase suppressor of Ras 2 [Manacus vitellinus]
MAFVACLGVSLYQSKLVKYFSRQLSCKRKVALQERNAKLEGFPQLLHWFRIVDIRKEVMEVGLEAPPGASTLPGGVFPGGFKSHEFQLGHRVDEAHTPKVKKKNKPLNLKIHNSVGSCENIPAQRSPLLAERSLRSFFVGYPPFLPSTPPVHTEATFSANTLSVPRWSPQIPRRDLGNSIKHRFSTKYWMSQTCTVCGKGMLFGLKCKNCKLKCHNKCTKEAPPCHLLIIHRGGRRAVRGEADLHCKPLPPTLPLPPFLFRFPTARARLVRTESVPCDINNPLRKPPRYSDLHVSQTLPKTNKLNRTTSQCPTSRIPAATPPPPRPPRPPRRRRRCRPARHPRPPCTPPRSARASRSSSTCQLPITTSTSSSSFSQMWCLRLQPEPHRLSSTPSPPTPC